MHRSGERDLNLLDIPMLRPTRHFSVENIFPSGGEKIAGSAKMFAICTEAGKQQDHGFQLSCRL